LQQRGERYMGGEEGRSDYFINIIGEREREREAIKFL